MPTLDEMKNYLRVDFDDDNALITQLILSATALVKDVARIETDEELASVKNADIAVYYATGYLYEHREEADHHELTLTLRALLFGARKAGF